MIQLNRRVLSAAAAAALCCAAASTASGQCATYSIAPGPGTFTAGDTDLGLYIDDGTTVVALPFFVSLYGASFGTANVSTNGNIQFATNGNSWTNNCLPSATFQGPTIFALWDDLYTAGGAAVGQGIFTKTTGESPNQEFTIEWRTVDCCAGTIPPIHFFCVKFYENATFFDVVYQTIAASGTDSTVGIQNSATGPFSQFGCNPSAITSGTSLRFTCEATEPSGACCISGTGVCSITSSNGCVGGTFRGNNSVCGAIPCGTGACCSGGNCTFTTGDACIGNFQGHGVSCGGNTYTFTLGGGSAFEDISATGTDVAAAPGDDASFNVTLSFPFTFYGTAFNSVNVCTNGFLQFNGAQANYTNLPIPNVALPNNLVAVLWDDFNFNVNAADSLKHETRGTAGTDLRQIFQWTNVAQYLAPAETDFNTFQCVLFEGGRIEYRYADISDQSFEGIAGNPGSTIGVEDSTGSALSAQFATGNGAASSNTNIRITAQDVPSPCNSATTGACCCGSSCSVTTSAACIGLNQAFVGTGTVCTPFSFSSPCCRANYNKSAPILPAAPGGVSVQDIFDYLTGYFNNDPCANTNDSAPIGSPPSAISVQDVFDFLTAYFGGC